MGLESLDVRFDVYRYRHADTGTGADDTPIARPVTNYAGISPPKEECPFPHLKQRMRHCLSAPISNHKNVNDPE